MEDRPKPKEGKKTVKQLRISVQHYQFRGQRKAGITSLIGQRFRGL